MNTYWLILRKQFCFSLMWGKQNYYQLLPFAKTVGNTYTRCDHNQKNNSALIVCSKKCERRYTIIEMIWLYFSFGLQYVQTSQNSKCTYWINPKTATEIVSIFISLIEKQATLIRNRLNETIQVGLIKSQTKNLPFQDKACFTDHHCFYCKLIRWTLQKTHVLLARQESLWMFEYDVVFCILQLRKMGVATFEIKITQIGMIPFNIKSCYGQCSLGNLSHLIFNQSIQRGETRMTTGQT